MHPSVVRPAFTTAAAAAGCVHASVWGAIWGHVHPSVVHRRGLQHGCGCFSYDGCVWLCVDLLPVPLLLFAGTSSRRMCCWMTQARPRCVVLDEERGRAAALRGITATGLTVGLVIMQQQPLSELTCMLDTATAA
jgi:hypothetical protein